MESARLELISRGTGEIAGCAWAAQFSLEQVRDERFGLWIRRVKYHEAEFTELPLEPGGKSIYQSDSGSVGAAKLGDEVFGKVRPGEGARDRVDHRFDLGAEDHCASRGTRG